jgi:RNA polymerase sigma-70 factor (ECF subfamily)
MSQTTTLPLAHGSSFDDLERHRRALTAYCYRMLGSAFDAEDAVQQTMVRAWRGIDGYERRGSLEAWLFRIATNVCLTALRGRSRRALPIDLSPSAAAGESLGAPRTAETWVEPMPDERLLGDAADPADLAGEQESVRLAFVAALQLLAPRQRAVLILRDVLRWKAEEVAELLGTSVVSVKSALQRARATIAAQRGEWPSSADGGEQQRLLGRYLDAFQRYDVDSLVALLHEDSTLSMPPFDLWLDGRAAIEAWWRNEARVCAGSVGLPVRVNGTIGVAQYRPVARGHGFEPFAIQVIDVAGNRIRALDVFLDTRLFRLFGVPSRLP